MIAVLLVAMLAQTAARPAVGTGAIQGIVLKAVTREPLAGATIEIRRDGETGPPAFTTITESNGQFVFQNVRSGRYAVAITRPGFVSRTVTLSVTEGQPLPLVQMAMTPTGAIAGRVLGGSNEPLGNVLVEALRPSYRNGRRTLTSVQFVTTDDRGEYRLFWLPPGKYFIRATRPEAVSIARGLSLGMTSANRFGTGSFSIGGNASNGGIFAMRFAADPGALDAFGPADAEPDQYVAVYFPSTIDEQLAMPIDVRAAGDMGGVDIRVSPVRKRRVRGLVVNGATGQVAQFAGLTELDPELSSGGGPGGIGGGLSNNGLNPIAQDGSFEVTLLPGRHTLAGTAGTGVGYVTLDVGDQDIDGVRIVAMPAFDVAARITADGPLDMQGLANVRVSFLRDLPISAGSTSYSQPRPDGTFVLSASPGDYRVNVAPLLNFVPPSPFARLPASLGNIYVKTIRIANVDILNGGVRLEGPTASPVEIVLGTNPGRIEGAVSTQAGGVAVVLAPTFRQRFDLYQTATTDPSGRFRFDRVPPAEYTVFAWDELGDGAWQDPAFFGPYEGRGVSLRVSEGATATVQVPVIPSQ